MVKDVFQAEAFGSWVPGFVARSNAMSRIARAPTTNEIAAHRGLFARPRIGPDQLAVFHAYMMEAADMTDAGTLDEKLRLPVAELLASDMPADGLFDAFGRMNPFRDGNGRCARALWMWRRLRNGKPPEDRPDAPMVLPSMAAIADR